MILLKGTIQHGQVVLPRPAELPDGTEVTVLSHGNGVALGMREEDWPTTPEEIAALLARMDAAEALEMTPAVEADLEAWRQKVKKYKLAHQDRSIEGLFE